MHHRSSIDIFHVFLLTEKLQSVAVSTNICVSTGVIVYSFYFDVLIVFDFSSTWRLNKIIIIIIINLRLFIMIRILHRSNSFHTNPVFYRETTNVVAYQNVFIFAIFIKIMNDKWSKSTDFIGAFWTRTAQSAPRLP